MIKVENGRIDLEGTGVEIIIDLVYIIGAIAQEAGVSKEEVLTWVEKAVSLTHSGEESL